MHRSSYRAFEVTQSGALKRALGRVDIQINGFVGAWSEPGVQGLPSR